MLRDCIHLWVVTAINPAALQGCVGYVGSTSLTEDIR